MSREMSWKKEFLARRRRFAGRIALTGAAASATFHELFSKASGIVSALGLPSEYCGEVLSRHDTTDGPYPKLSPKSGSSS